MSQGGSPLSCSPSGRSVQRRKLARSVELPREINEEMSPARTIPEICVSDPSAPNAFSSAYSTLVDETLPHPSYLASQPKPRRRSMGEGVLNKLSYLEAQHEISHSQLAFINKLGEGAFGEVWRAFLWDTEVAVKVLKGNFLRTSPLEELAEEVAMLKSLRHPNCVLFLGFTRPPNFCIITEYLALGSLRSLLNNEAVRLSNKMIVRIALNIARGMNYLHTQSPAILHRDLNSMNILCSENWTIKVADYGLSQTSNSSMEFCGAVPWRAPEAKVGFFVASSDVYSFGIILWEMVTRELPWDGIPMPKVLERVRSGDRPAVPDSCPVVLSKLMQDCWHADYNARPTFQQIIELLRPYEKREDYRSSCELLLSPGSQGWHDRRLSGESDFAYQETCDDWSMFQDGTFVCQCWEMLLLCPAKRKGLEFVTVQCREMKSFIDGSLYLRDPSGRILWLIGLASQEELAKTEEYFQKNDTAISRFTEHLCSPMSRHTMRVTPIQVRGGATHATVTHLQVREGLASECGSLYDGCLDLLRQHTDHWCGTLILSDYDGSSVFVITLFNNADVLRRLEAAGLNQMLMRAFYNLMAGLPMFLHYDILLDTFAPRSKLLQSELVPIEPIPMELGNEPILDSFFCLLLIGTERSAGHLFVCTEHLRYRGRVKLVGKERVFSVHLKNVISVDENRPFGRKGHTLQVTTRSGKHFVLRSLLQREKLLHLIRQQVEKLRPTHKILHLINGEPNIRI